LNLPSTPSTRAAPRAKDRDTEGALGIDNHVCSPVLRKVDRACPAVSGEVDAAQVRIDDLLEDPLVAADDHELSSGLALRGVASGFGVVVEHLSAVGVERSRRQDVSDTEFLLQAGDGRPDAL
jgi:hypothetical protein